MRDRKELTLYSNPHPKAIIEIKSKKVYNGWQNIFAILRNPNPDAFEIINFDDLKMENPKSKGSVPYWKDFWRLASAHPGAESLLLKAVKMDNIHDRAIHCIDTLSAGSNPCPVILERLFGSEGPLSGKIADAAFSLSANPAGFHFLLTSPELEKQIMGSQASFNPAPAAGEWLSRNPKKVDFSALSANPAPWAVEMLRANPDKIDYNALAKNTNADALDLFGKGTIKGTIKDDARFWQNLSSNPSPAAMELLRANPDKIFWNGVMANQSTEAMRLLAENFDRVDYSSWLILQQNPAIFEEFEVEVNVEVELKIEVEVERSNKIENLIDDGDIVTPPTTPICSYSDNWEDEDYCTPTI
jgi:hypothetical protein